MWAKGRVFRGLREVGTRRLASDCSFSKRLDARESPGHHVLGPPPVHSRSVLRSSTQEHLANLRRLPDDAVYRG
jgi:hypothetical protein